MSVLKKFRKASQGQAAPKQKSSFGGERVPAGFRYDENGENYWLTSDQMTELARLNNEIDDDADFWAAFAAMRARDGIKATAVAPPSSARKPSTGGGGYKSWGGGSGWSGKGWTDPTKKKSYLSEWWSGWGGSYTGKGAKGWGGWGGGIDAKDAKLAVMRRAIEVTLSVIDDTNKLHMKYSDDNDAPVSFTDMRSNLVVVSAKPVNDGLPDGQALDIMSGFGMHEASHSKYTRQLISELEKPTPLRPYAVAGLIANLAEDYRIEQLTGEEFPGFRDYFTAALDYMWKAGEEAAKSGKGGWAETYGPDLTSKMNSAIAIVKWENDFRAKITAKGKMADWQPEFDWWTKWRDDYNTNKTTLRQATEAALAHLRNAEDTEEGKEEERAESGQGGKANDEMDAQEDAENKAEAAGKALQDAINDFIEKNGINDFCTHRNHDATHKVSAGANDTIGQLIDEEVEFEEPKKRASLRGAPPPIIVTKPKETATSKRYYPSTPDPMVGRYRAALVFRPDKEIHSTKLLKRGKVDGTQLYRWAVDDWRMFQQKGRKVDPSAYVYLLVDMSGSMGGEKLRAAQRMARLFIQALTSMDGVTPKVFGHTGDTNQTSCDIYRLWEPGDEMSRNGLIMSLPHSNNYDGFAIEWVGERLAKESRNNEQRLLIVLSDGYPAGSGYGGSAAEAHVREVVDDLRRKHRIRTLQIAIDTSLDERRQKAMFDEFIPYRPGDALDSVPARLTKWLEKVL